MDVLSSEQGQGLDDAPPATGTGPLVCKQHPRVAAVFSCTACGTPICETCAFREPDGGAMCPECKVRRSPALLPPVCHPPVLPAVPAGTQCKQHTNVTATQQCRLCESYMCPTCDFMLSNGVHICPACASAPRPALGTRGKKLLIGSYVTAIWSTIGMSCLVSGVFGEVAQNESEQMILGWVLMLFVLAPAVAGLGMATSARRPRRSNPPSLWIALVWNSILVGCFVLLMLIGLMR